MTFSLCRKLIMLSIILFTSGCVSATSDRAICDGSAALRDAHTAALLQDGGDQSVVTGAALLAALDAAC